LAEPGIKGSVFAGIIEQVRILRASGRVAQRELEARLGKEGLAYLDEKIMAAKWYSIRVYGAIRELLRDVEGGGREEYTIQAGAESARRLIASGLYQQLDFLKRWRDQLHTRDREIERQRRSHFSRQLSLVSTIHRSLFNFGDLKIEQVPGFTDRFQLEYWDQGTMPRVCRLAVLGFWNELSRSWSARGRADLFNKVDADDHYMLVMTRDVADV